MSNNFADYLRSLDRNKLIRIYLSNNICILAEPMCFQFFDDYMIYDGKSKIGTMYFPDQKKIYPDSYERFEQYVSHMNIVPYSAISLITGAED